MERGNQFLKIRASAIYWKSGGIDARNFTTDWRADRRGWSERRWRLIWKSRREACAGASFFADRSRLKHQGALSELEHKMISPSGEG